MGNPSHVVGARASIPRSAPRATPPDRPGPEGRRSRPEARRSASLARPVRPGGTRTMTTSVWPQQPDRPPEYGPIPPRVARPWPTTVLWRWRYEIGISLVISLAGWALGRTIGAVWTAAATVVVATSVAAFGPLRNAVERRFLCVVMPHRVRAGLAQAWVHNRRGRLPTILWTRATRYGEAVLLWCPAGICERHVRAAADVLRAACWARHIQVTSDPRRRQLITVHIVHRAATQPRQGEADR